MTNTEDSNNNDNDKTVSLVSTDGHTFELPLSAAKHSRLVRDALNINEAGEVEEDDGDDDEHPDGDGGREFKPVDCLRVQADCLEKVVEYLKHYDVEKMIDIPVPLPANSFEECMTQEWYQQFVTNMDRENLFQLLTAANYMNIKPLLDLACLRVTFEVTGKSADEIRQYLRLPELTAEEEAQARENHPWIFEDNN